MKVSTPDQAREILAQEKPDLIVVDLQFPKVNSEKPAEPGLELLEDIFEQYPHLNILVSSADPRYLVRIKDGINNHEGGFVVSDKLDDAATYINKAKIALEGSFDVPKEIVPEMPISEQELEILKLLWHKCWNEKKIADKLQMSEKTVQNHIKNMKDKLNISSLYEDDVSEQAALCKEAVRLHLV